jgi:hypothetical protein
MAVPTMGIGLGGVSSYTSAWQFVDMMKYAREWRTPKGFEIVEDRFGWPVALKGEAGKETPIGGDKPVKMWIYNRRIAGDVVLTWQGDGEVAIRRRDASLVQDEVPQRRRRVYRWTDRSEGVFDLVVERSNPEDHVRDIRMWMPGFENAESPFHPLFRKRLEPFAYFRFMDWGGTNNSEQIEWADRKDPGAMRQTRTTAYEYMVRLCNEMDKDMWLCIPHKASDDYVRKLAELLKATLEPERKVWVEYSNEIWNGAFRQTQWLWDIARKRGHAQRPWEHGPVLCGRRSAQIWAIMDKALGDPDRIVRVITHFRWLDKALEAATDPQYGSGRVDVVALNGYFISQDALRYTLRSLEQFDIDRTLDDIEQLHILGKAASWADEIRRAKERWRLPVTVYEGGQHFANPFSSGLQGEELVKRMFEVNGHTRIRAIYRTALETWRLGGGDGFTPFVDCGNWSKYGCWGHLRYQAQPLEDVVDPATGKVVEPAAYKYLALLDYIERWKLYDPARAPRVTKTALPDVIAGKPYAAKLTAEGGLPPYRWSLLGGRLPKGLALREDGTLDGTAAKAEQLACIVDVTDAAGRHGSRVLGLFMSPASALANAVVFQNGLPEGWDTLGQKPGLPYLPASAEARGYTVAMTCSAAKALSIHARPGLAVNLSPKGEAQDYLRVAIDGLGRNVQAYSRYVRNGRGELWGPRTCRLLPDEGEGENDPTLDPGERWTIRVTVRPGSSPGTIDLLVSVFDEAGKSRLDSSKRYDVANGIWLLRELALKDALRSGPFGLMTRDVTVHRVAWTLH